MRRGGTAATPLSISRPGSLGLLGALAGCANGLETHVGSVADGSTPTGDVELPVPDDQLTAVAGTDAIAAIVDHAFGTGRRDPDASLSDDVTLIGGERDGEAPPGPLPILKWGEVVTDESGGPLLVTSCPLRDSGVTGVRRVGGKLGVFGVSGQRWTSDLVMADRATDSL